MENTISKVLIGLWVILLVTPIVLGVLSCVAENIWFRGTKKFYMAGIFQEVLWRRLNNFLERDPADWEHKRYLWDFEPTVGSWFVYNAVFSGVILAGSACLIDHGYFTQVLYGLLIVLGFLFIPMILVDMYKALRYNIKTGELTEVDKMKQQIKDLENKLKEKDPVDNKD